MIPSAPIHRVASTRLPTPSGLFQIIGFEREISSGRVETALAIMMGDLNGEAPLVRIHSQCFTGEVLGSLRCDCKDQLEMAMRAIAGEGCGLVIYEHQEGRGIGLMAKLQAYSLQDAGLDTVDANHALGLDADCRDFSFPVAILQDLNLSRVRLLTNNPRKSHALCEAGIEVVALLPCEVMPNQHSFAYLRAKKEKMGHKLSLGQHQSRNQITSMCVDGRRDQFQFASIDVAISELQAGRMIVVVDDEDRENEGDLTIAAEMITPDAINFMATYG